jgi:hypothetical protein
MTTSEIEPATFRFVAQYLNHCATISGPRPYKYVLIKYMQTYKCRTEDVSFTYQRQYALEIFEYSQKTTDDF